MTIGSKIKELRLKQQLTQTDLAKKIGVATQTIFKYENEIVTNIPSDKIEKIAEVLNTTPAYLMGWEEDPENIYEKYGLRPIVKKRFPLLGEIACGEPKFCVEGHTTYIEASANINADFCLIAKADSMINARIFDGDIVFIREQPEVENGEIAAVIIDNETTLKRVYIKPDRIILRPENPIYDDIIYEHEEMSNVRILGKAVALQTVIG